MAGDALAWYQWMHHSGLVTTWEDFTKALEPRFGSSSFENHQQALFKLQQTSNVADYQKQFEQLCNKVIGPQSAILDCFISGLKPPIQHELAILQPSNISQAISLAKLVESKLSASRPFPNYYHKPSPPKPPRLYYPAFPLA